MKKIEKFPKLVVNEATKLRELTTVEERKNLDFEQLHPVNGKHCIYGQLTGNCHSARSGELMKKACSRVYHFGMGISRPGKLNGSPKNLERFGPRENITFWSPIEVFITTASYEQNKALINYIKKRRHSLPS